MRIGLAEQSLPLLLFLPIAVQAAPARFVVDTLRMDRQCDYGDATVEFPHLRSLRRGGQDVSDAVNGAIRRRFDIEDDSKPLDCWGWSGVEFTSNISERVLWIDWNGCYLGAYETCYAEHFAFDLADEGKPLEKVEFEPYQLLDPDWTEACAAVMAEASECASFDAYCSCDAPVYNFSKDGVSVSLSDDCYPHVALACTPTLQRTASLGDLDSLLTPLGRKVLLKTPYLKSDGLRRYLVYRRERPAASE